jgi:uncharacterized protein
MTPPADGDTALLEPTRAESTTERVRAAPPRRRGRRSLSTQTHRWSRLIHVYTSMIAFSVVLFFSVTGITLNHPTWVFGSKPHETTVTGTLPATSVSGTEVDWLAVSEYFRNARGVRGAVTDKRINNGEGSITYKGPGYEADAFFKVPSGTYELNVQGQGFLGVINDLHKGRDVNRSWKWLIDVSAGFLTLVSLSGLTMQFFLRKRRRSAFTTVAVGTVIVAIATWFTLR